MQEYLTQTYYIDCENDSVKDFSRGLVHGLSSDIERAVKIFYAVRDGVRYNPYAMTLDRKTYRASFVLAQKQGFCIQKAILLAAVTRAAGIPSRLRFADVKNHLVTQRLKEIMKSDLFVFHGYTELFLGEKWVKATPTFNLSLCQKFGVFPLEFDGIHDSIFHPFDRKGKKHMEYLRDYGSFPDFPYEQMVEENRKQFPHLIELARNNTYFLTGDFEREAAEEN